MGLLERVRPDLVPLRTEQPQPRPDPRERDRDRRDRRPEWRRRMEDEHKVPQGVPSY